MTDDLEVPKVHKNNLAMTMEAIVLNLKLVRGVRGVPWPLWLDSIPSWQTFTWI